MSSITTPSIALLFGRVGFGVVFVAHGLKKLNEVGLAGLTASYATTSVPLPGIVAYFTTFVELIGGVLLIVGAFTGLAGLLLLVDMLGGLFFAHLRNGIFVSAGGFEFVLVLGLGALLLAVFGAGRYSIDELIEYRIGWASGLSRY
jgi:putative oxidoreductase